MLLAWAAALTLPAPSARAASAASPAAAPGGPLLVVLDPGHGGPAPREGAHGPEGLVEKTIVLQVARRLKLALEAGGATVVLTRDDDLELSLADRARLANEVSADLFLSIHCNSMATRRARAKVHGVETYFLSPDPTDAEARMLAELENGGPDAVPVPKGADPVTGLLADLALGQARSDSAAFAQALHRSLVRGTSMRSRGVRQAPFLVLSGTKMPSALVEIGFISHPSEGRQLAREAVQQRIADALAAGIRDFAARVLEGRLERSPGPGAGPRTGPPGLRRPPVRGSQGG
jgi:N-acetylmuramoyl-L-alanine amidase